MMYEGRTVFVTGATGFLGGALVHALAEQGATVKALARRTGRDRYIANTPNVELVAGNILTPDQVEVHMRGCEIVFHVAAALDGPIDEQRKVNVTGTTNMVRAAHNTGVQRFIHVSSIAVYGYSVRGRISEDHPQQPTVVPYNISKSEAEEALCTQAAQMDLPYSIIRPAMIYGPRSNAWTRTMFTLANRARVPFVGDGSGTTHPVYVDDVVSLMLHMALHPAAVGEAFHCAPDLAPTWREFLGAYAALGGHDGWLALPPGLLRVLAPLIDAGLSLRKEPQAIGQLIDYVSADTVYAMDKARDLLGWQAGVSLEEGIQRSAVWLREKGLLA